MKKLLTVLVVLGAVLAVTGLAFAEDTKTKTVTPVEDTYIDIGDRDAFNGGSQYLIIGYPDSDLSRFRVSALKFQVTLPEGSTVESATLNLKPLWDSENGGHLYWMQHNDWNKTMTHRTAVPLGEYIGKLSEPVKAGSQVSIDVPIEGSGTYSFYVAPGPPVKDQVVYYSGVSQHPPRLTLQYN